MTTYETPKEPARRHDDGKPDDRYTLTWEYVGYSVPMLVLRFCGESIGLPRGIMAARRTAENHHNEMMGLN